MFHISSGWAHLTPTFLLCCLCLVANAQIPSDQEFIRERQEHLLQEQQQRLDDLQRLPGDEADERASTIPEDNRCFAIELIELEGASLLSDADRARVLVPFTGRCLGLAQLDELLEAVSEHYIGRGHITTRAYLAPQDLGSGTLRVIVIEGRLEGLDGSIMASDLELAMAFPGVTGEVLDLRELEQMVDTFNRLPSRSVRLELLPGEQVGSTRLSLQGERSKPWKVSLGRHNEGQSSSGEQQWSLGISWDSPLGLADHLGLRTSRDGVSDRYRDSRSHGLHYGLPYGWWRLDYSYSYSRYRTLGRINDFSFKRHGDNQHHGLRVERVLHRDAMGKTALNLGISHLRSHNYLLGRLLRGASHRLSEAHLGFNHGRRLGAAFVNLDAGWQRGMGLFDAQADHGSGSDAPRARYDKYSLTLSYLQPMSFWSRHLSFESLATGQKSNDVLHGPQRISIGALSSVRGFKQYSLSGDEGGYWRNQLLWTQPVAAPLIQPQISQYGVSLAYDVGAIRHSRYNGGASGRLSGHALELSARGENLSVGVTLAHSLKRPSAISQSERPLHFRLEMFF